MVRRRDEHPGALHCHGLGGRGVKRSRSCVCSSPHTPALIVHIRIHFSRIDMRVQTTCALSLRLILYTYLYRHIHADRGQVQTTRFDLDESTRKREQVLVYAAVVTSCNVHKHMNITAYIHFIEEYSSLSKMKFSYCMLHFSFCADSKFLMYIQYPVGPATLTLPL
jgi:hypothetical protein